MTSLCKRCSNTLSGKQQSYCSYKCSKLHLKSLWRKRKRDHIREYNRRYRSLGLRPLSSPRLKKIISSRGGKCERCGGIERLNVHHIKPLRFGGNHNLVMVLCFQCHMKWENRMKGYWENQSMQYSKTVVK